MTIHKTDKSKLIDCAIAIEGDKKYRICDLLILGYGGGADDGEDGADNVLLRPQRGEKQVPDPIDEKTWIRLRNKVDNFFSLYQGNDRINLEKELDDSWRRSFLSDMRNVKETNALSPRKKTSGYIYVIKNNEGHYKIGISRIPKTRIDFLGVKLPFPIEAVHVFSCDDSYEAESFLHDKYRREGKGLVGEWFKLEDNDVEMIKKVSSYKNGEFILK